MPLHDDHCPERSTFHAWRTMGETRERARCLVFAGLYVMRRALAPGV